MEAKTLPVDPDPELAYDTIAGQYDDFTAHHDYDLWIDRLLPALKVHGLRGSTVLDAGCGTGKSSLPMLDRGWLVTACDNSAGMLARLEAKSAGRIDVFQADLRELETVGKFDLILCLGDVLNYCAATTPLETVLTGLRRNLAPGGLLLFDLNTLTTYRTFYAETQKVELEGGTVSWRGLGDGTAKSGEFFESSMEIDLEGSTTTRRAVHRQRHQDEATVRTAIAKSGLECLDVFGHGFDGVLEQPVDEDRHTKAIFIARDRNHEEKRR